MLTLLLPSPIVNVPRLQPYLFSSLHFKLVSPLITFISATYPSPLLSISKSILPLTVHLSSKSGDVFLENSTVKEVRANSVSGDAEIENVIAEKLYITSVSGDTEIRAKSNSIQAQSTSGDIGVVAEGNIVGSFQVVSGNIDLEIDNNGEGYVAEMNVMSHLLY